MQAFLNIHCVMLSILTFHEVNRIEAMPTYNGRRASNVQNSFEDVLERPILVKYATFKDKNTNLSTKYKKDFQVKTLEDFLAEKRRNNQMNDVVYEISSDMEKSMFSAGSNDSEEINIGTKDSELLFEESAEKSGEDTKTSVPQWNSLTFKMTFVNNSHTNSLEEAKTTQSPNSFNFAWPLESLISHEAAFKDEEIDTSFNSTRQPPIMNDHAHFKEKNNGSLKDNGMSIKTPNSIQCNSFRDLEAKLHETNGEEKKIIKLNKTLESLGRFANRNQKNFLNGKLLPFISNDLPRNERSIKTIKLKEVSELSDPIKGDSVIIIENTPLSLGTTESNLIGTHILGYTCNNRKKSGSETYGHIQKYFNISDKRQHPEEYYQENRLNIESFGNPEFGKVDGIVKDDSGDSPSFYILFHTTKIPNENINGMFSLATGNSQGANIFLTTSSPEKITLMGHHIPMISNRNEMPSVNLFLTTKNANEHMNLDFYRYKNDEKYNPFWNNINQTTKNSNYSTYKKLLQYATRCSPECYKNPDTKNQYNLFQTTGKINTLDKETWNNVNMWKRDFTANNLLKKTFPLNISNIDFRTENESELITSLKEKIRKGLSNLVDLDEGSTEGYKLPTFTWESLEASYNEIENENSIDGLFPTQTSASKPLKTTKSNAWKIIILEQEEATEPYSLRAANMTTSEGTQTKDNKSSNGEQNSCQDNLSILKLRRQPYCKSVTLCPSLEPIGISSVCPRDGPSINPGIQAYGDSDNSSSHPVAVEIRFFFDTKCSGTTPTDFMNTQDIPIHFDLNKNCLNDRSYHEYSSQKERKNKMNPKVSSIHDKINGVVNIRSTRKPIKRLMQELLDAIEHASDEYGDYSYYLSGDEGSTKISSLVGNSQYDVNDNDDSLTEPKIKVQSSTITTGNYISSPDYKFTTNTQNMTESMNKNTNDNNKSYLYNNLAEDININNAVDIRKLQLLKKKLLQYKSLNNFDQERFSTPISFGNPYSFKIQMTPFDFKILNSKIKGSIDDLFEFDPSNGTNNRTEDYLKTLNEKNKYKKNFENRIGSNSQNFVWEELFMPSSKQIKKISKALKNDTVHNNEPLTNTTDQIISNRSKGGITSFFENLFRSKKMRNDNSRFNNTTPMKKIETKINHKNTTNQNSKLVCNPSDCFLRPCSNENTLETHENLFQEILRKKRMSEEAKSDNYKNIPSHSNLRKRVTKLLQPEDVNKKFQNLQKNLQDLQNIILIHSKRHLDEDEKNLTLQIRVIIDLVNTTLPSHINSTNKLLKKKSKETPENNDLAMENVPILFNHDSPLKENKETIGNAGCYNSSQTEYEEEFKRNGLSKISKHSVLQMNENIIENITALIDLLIENLSKRRNTESQKNQNVRIKRHRTAKVFPTKEMIRKGNFQRSVFRRRRMISEDSENKFHNKDRFLINSKINQLCDILTLLLRKALEKDNESKISLKSSQSPNKSDFIRGYRQALQHNYLKKIKRKNNPNNASYVKEKWQSNNTNELEKRHGFKDQIIQNQYTTTTKNYSSYFDINKKNYKIKTKSTDPLSKKVLKEIWLIENELKHLMTQKSHGSKPQKLLLKEQCKETNTECTSKKSAGVNELNKNINKCFTEYKEVPLKIKPLLLKAMQLRENDYPSFKLLHNNGLGSLYEEILSIPIVEQKETTTYLNYKANSNPNPCTGLECRPKKKNAKDKLRNKTTKKTSDSAIIIEDEIVGNELNFKDGRKSHCPAENEIIQTEINTIKSSPNQNELKNKNTSSNMSILNYEKCESITCENIPNEGLISTKNPIVTRSPENATMSSKFTEVAETTFNITSTETTTRRKSTETCSKDKSTTVTKQKNTSEESLWKLKTKTTIKHRGIQCHHNYKNHTNRKEHRMTTKHHNIIEMRNRLFWKIIP